MNGIHPDPMSFTATQSRFGEGVVEELPDVLERLGIASPLVVTDDGVREAGVLERVTAPLGEHEVFYSPTEPATTDFDDVPVHDVDGVVAVGGGSAIDSAKVVAVLLAHGGHPDEYIGSGNLPGAVAPFVAVPTTSGTGSETTQTAVVTHEGVKRGISDERLRPSFALVDPELTYPVPRPVTARSGFDAFMHAFEGLTAREYRWVSDRPITYQGANPISRALARRAFGLVHRSLGRAVYDGDDHEARRGMSLGSHLAALAHSNSGLGVVHALASSVGGITGRPHGECLAASLETGIRYNLPVRRTEYADLAREMGVGDTAEDLIDELARIRDCIGLPSSFADVGLERADTDRLVEATLVQERRLLTNPREVTDDIRETIETSFE